MLNETRDEHSPLDSNAVSGNTPGLATLTDTPLDTDETGPTIEAFENPNTAIEPIPSPSREPSPVQANKVVPEVSALQPGDHARPLWKIWGVEIASIILSISLLIVLVVVCQRFDQESLPNWPLSITLNTFVAFFSMAAKAAFMLPVSVAISQTQWDWFLRERPLYDFYIFDQASRGPLGSLIFLKRIHVRHFASLGALLMVVSTMTAPVTQLTISYPLRDSAVPDQATVRTSRSMHETKEGYQASLTLRAIYQAVSLDTSDFSDQIVAPVKTECSTGNCTFPSYESLGVCMETANITSQLRFAMIEDGKPLGIPFYDHEWSNIILNGSGPAWEAILPGGTVLAHQSHFAVAVDTVSGNKTFGFEGKMDLLRTRIASFTLVYTKPIFNDRIFNDSKSHLADKERIRTSIGFQYEAMEILYYLCVKAYRTTVQGGHESTEITGLASQTADAQDKPFFNMDCTSLMQDDPAPCVSDEARRNHTIQLEPMVTGQQQTGRFDANYPAFQNMSSILAYGLQSYSALIFHPKLFPDGTKVTRGDYFVNRLFDVALFSRQSNANSTLRDRRARNIFQNVAIALSSQMLDPNSVLPQSVVNITGQAWRQQSYVRINWGWMSFLAVEIVLAVGFLTCTAVSQSIHQRKEKNQSIPLCYRDAKDSVLAQMVALGPQCREEASEGFQSISELKKVSRNLKVKLQGNEVISRNDLEENDSPPTAN